MISYYDGYIDGLFNLASSVSKNIGPSFIRASLYDKDKFYKEFKKNYRLKDNVMNIVETKRSFKQVLHEWLDDEHLEESILYWINLKFGKNIKVLASDNDQIIDQLSGYAGGVSGFYFVEDIYFIEYDKYMLVLIMGNNE